MKNTLIIYHREDNDGACSAGIVQAFISRYPIIRNAKIHFNECDLYGVNYADLAKDWDEFKHNRVTPNGKKPKMLKWDKYMDIFMVDISFNDPEAMNYMSGHWPGHFHWCDHHAPIIEQGKSMAFGKALGVRRTDQSAILNTWQYLSGLVMQLHYDIPMPSHYLHMLSDYDSWAYTKMEEYNSEETRTDLFRFNTGCTRCSNLKPEWFRNWVCDLLDGYMLDHELLATNTFNYGKTVYDLDVERIARAINTHGDTNWIVETPEGLRKACALISTDRFNSLSFAKFIGTDIVHGLVFKIDPANDKVVMSMYNVNDDDDFDCGAFLKAKYNGGGHKGAAGCTLTREEFGKIFITRKF